MDLITLALAKKYTETIGSGIESVTAVNNKVHFITKNATEFDVILPYSIHEHTNLNTILESFTIDETGNLFFDGTPITSNIGVPVSYLDIINKPSINGVVLSGNKTLVDLGIQPVGDYALNSSLPIVDVNKLYVDTELTNKVSKIAGQQLITTTELASINSHRLSKTNPHDTSLGNLSDLDINNPLDNQTLAYNAITSKWENVDVISPSDEKLKMSSDSTSSKYLDQLIDNNTIIIENETLVVKSVKGVTSAELLCLSGMDTNIKALLSTLSSGGMQFRGVVNTKADLNAITGMSVGELYICLVDESQGSVKTSYVYNNSWISLGESNVNVRDFTIDKLDLVSETKGILPIEKVNTSTLVKATDLSNYTNNTDLSTNYSLKTDLIGKANSSDIYTKIESDGKYVVKELNKSIVLDSEVAKIHEHTNKSILDNINTTKITEWNSKANPVHVHAISDVTGLQTSLDNKVDDSQVLTNVPINAIFTDTVYVHPTSHSPSIIAQDSNNRFMTDIEKAKVDKIITDGDGTKYLNDLGDYVAIEGGTGSGSSINDLVISPTETYSSSKITGITGDINDVALPSDLQGKSLVDMVKVNFTNANEAKNYIVNAIGDSSLATNTFLEISNSLLTKKQAIVDALATKSIITNQSNDISDYATSINSIVQNSQIKNTKLNKTSGTTSQIVLANPTTIQNISTSVLEYQAGETGVVKYECNFNNGDETSFDTNVNQHLIFDGKMKQDNNISVKNMTNKGITGDYTSYSAIVDKTQFNKINSITVSTDGVLTVAGTYRPTLVQANSDIDLAGIDRISDIVWTTTTTNTSELLLIYSIDSGFSWKGYDVVNQLVLDITDANNLGEVKAKGISTTNLNSFTQTDLDNMRNGSPKIRFAYYIEKNNVSDILENDSITLYVDMTGKDIFSTHYTVSFDGIQTLTYTFSADKTYTIIYTDNN